ncbi:hypothetical protein B0T21DRAFT_102675 [Apiosordaria backusii]|uniref:Uncharacterized protein n=1 Tax=Apiosordaria backusii TaxID=314023 RepID=A0AA40K4C2_9PEZI|nr:hypothetical protein B0T21DRAFT_102675 [Apiosordaria backusii]
MDSSDEQVSVSELARSTSPPPSQFSRASSHRGREYALYDAVAGQVSLNERVQPHAGSSRRHYRPGSGTFNARTFKLAPEEVLFRRHNAPARYAEHDIYWASEDLLPSQQLPDSALLKSVHCYASKFYDYTALSASAPHSQQQIAQPQDPTTIPGQTQPHSGFFQKKANTDLQSLDETALLAFGVLLEEASREVLGKRGDLVFTEAEGYQPPQLPPRKPGSKTAPMAVTPVPLKDNAPFFPDQVTTGAAGKGEGKGPFGGPPENDVSQSEGGPKKRRKVARKLKTSS